MARQPDEIITISLATQQRLMRYANAEADQSGHGNVEAAYRDYLNEYLQENDGDLCSRPFGDIMWVNGREVAITWAQED